MDDDIFLSQLNRYGKFVASEHGEGGEISLGWLITEAHDKEIWQIFGGQETKLHNH
jgi:hypothetical protein